MFVEKCHNNKKDIGGIYMDRKKMKELVGFIVSFLIDRTGNEIFDKRKERRKIVKILKEDIENIKQIFWVVRDDRLYNLIEEYIMYFAFREIRFYSPIELTKEQENELWDSFEKYINNETGDNYVDIEYKNRLIRCLNFHNKQINEIIMDDKSQININLMNRQHRSIEKSLNYIINTLNTDTKLQDKDDELDYAVEQLESIVKSYRYDVNQLRRMQILSMCGAMAILFFIGIFLPNAMKDVDSFSPAVVMCFFFSLVSIILLAFWRNISQKAQILEDELMHVRKILWELHIKIYQKQMEKEYDCN